MIIPSFKRTRFWLNLALWFFGNVFPTEGDLGNVNKCSIIEQTAAKIALTYLTFQAYLSRLYEDRNKDRNKRNGYFFNHQS